METVISRVIRLLGSQKRLATVTGVTEQAVSKWKKTGVIPVERCANIVSAVGGRVSFMELRPDIFCSTTEPLSAEVKSSDDSDKRISSQRFVSGDVEQMNIGGMA